MTYDYLIVGAGAGGISACEGIREHDKRGTIMLAGNEIAMTTPDRLEASQTQLLCRVTARIEVSYFESSSD